MQRQLRAPTVEDLVASRNGGHNSKHMAAVRAARKARNVKRHRAHMKGKHRD